MNEENVFISFSIRNKPIPVDYRPLYKIAHLSLILFFCCKEKKSSLLKLHLFAWLLKSKKNMILLKKIIESEGTTTWGVDVSVNKALHFAIAEEIFIREGNAIKLTQKGLLFVQKILLSEIMLKEIQFLKGVSLSVTESKISELSKKWS